MHLTPWTVPEALDQEIEKGTHLGHAMPTLRINRRKWHRLSHVAFCQHRFKSSLADRFSDEQIRKPHNSAPGNGEP